MSGGKGHVRAFGNAADLLHQVWGVRLEEREEGERAGVEVLAGEPGRVNAAQGGLAGEDVEKGVGVAADLLAASFAVLAPQLTRSAAHVDEGKDAGHRWR